MHFHQQKTAKCNILLKLNKGTDDKANHDNTEKSTFNSEEIEMFQAYNTTVPSCGQPDDDQKPGLNNEQCGNMETFYNHINDDENFPTAPLLEKENSSHQTIVGIEKESTEQTVMSIDSMIQSEDILNFSNDSLAEILPRTPTRKKIATSVDSYSNVLQRTPNLKDNLNASDSLTEEAQFNDLLKGVEWSPLPTKVDFRLGYLISLKAPKDC